MQFELTAITLFKINTESKIKNHESTITKFTKNNKLRNLPVIKKWLENGGNLTIETLEDGNQIWKYTNKTGDTVPYITKNINGSNVKVPDFSEYLHPNSKISEVNIGNFSGDRAKDIQTF